MPFLSCVVGKCLPQEGFSFVTTAGTCYGVLFRDSAHGSHVYICGSVTSAYPRCVSEDFLGGAFSLISAWRRQRVCIRGTSPVSMILSHFLHNVILYRLKNGSELREEVNSWKGTGDWKTLRLWSHVPIETAKIELEQLLKGSSANCGRRNLFCFRSRRSRVCEIKRACGKNAISKGIIETLSSNLTMGTFAVLGFLCF